MESTDSIINKCVDVLNNSGIILFPTDTIIGLGCDATNDEAVIKLVKLKQRSSKKGFIVLVSSFEMLKNYVADIPASVNKLVEKAQSPVSIIYPNGKNLSGNVLGDDGSIAIRIVKSGFTHDLIAKYNKAIVSTSVNISGSIATFDLKEVPESILSGLDYVVNLPQQEERKTKASTILKLNPKGKIEIIRE